MSSFVCFIRLTFLLSPPHLVVMDKDLSSAKALYEQIQKEGMVMDELSLKRLAVLYRNAEETAPFHEPPVSHTHTQRKDALCHSVANVFGSSVYECSAECI